jgi:hypothetical protein
MIVTEDFVFVHVPKTGGQFLRAAIEKTCYVVPTDLPYHAAYSLLPAEYRDRPAIAFVRNPWDWYVSIFRHWQRHGAEDDAWGYKELGAYLGDFHWFVKLACLSRGRETNVIEALMRWRGLDYYSALMTWFAEYGDQWAEIGRFENLRDEFTEFLDRHGIEAPGLREAVADDPRVNVGDGVDYRTQYPEWSKNLVGQTQVAKRFRYAF